MFSKKVLVIENTELMVRLVTDVLKWEGYTTISCLGYSNALNKLREEKPDIVIIGVHREIEGFELCEKIKASLVNNLLPMIILTEQDNEQNRLRSLEIGADGYVVMPFNPKELINKVNNILKIVDRNRGANPLTGLPGNNTIQAEINQRLEKKEKFAVLYGDLDNFKAYNDVYGFTNGDKAIILTADIINEAVSSYGNINDFVGHVGGDDFIAVTTPDKVDDVCSNIIKEFDNKILDLYNDDDKERGYIISKDRQGNTAKFNVIGISIAVVSNEHRELVSTAQIAEIAAEVKKKAKAIQGSNYVIDKRTD